MNISLRQLRVFLAVASERSFSRAGDRIGLTQPAVSRAIHELEAQMGLRLLDRSTREVALTEAGQSLAGRLPRVLDELDQALVDVRELGQTRRGRVRVASSPTISAHLMPACIAACAQREPDIELMLLDRIQQDVLSSVRAGEVDFGVVIEPLAPDDLHGETILRDPFVAVLPAGHPLAARRQLRWQALDGAPLVLLDHASGSRRLIDRALAEHGAEGRVVQEVGHPTTVFSMVEAGLGLSVMPALAMPPPTTPAGIVARPLTPRIQREIVMVHRRQHSLSPLATRVWALIREMAALRSPANG